MNRLLVLFLMNLMKLTNCFNKVAQNHYTNSINGVNFSCA